MQKENNVVEEISYKNLDLLKKYTSERGKILPVRLTGLNTQQQRKLSNAVKRARFLGLIAAAVK